MNVDKKTRLELNALSKEVFGTTSRWSKLISQGYDEVEAEEVTESAPSEVEGEPPTETTNKIPVSLGTNSFKFKRKHLDLSNVKEYMLEQKQRISDLEAQITKLHKEEFERRAKLEEDKKTQDKAKELTQQFGNLK